MSVSPSSIYEKELTLLHKAVEQAEQKRKDLIVSPIIIKIFDILEQFLRSKKLVCYGGTAINNILPTKDQFYNKEIELPDYDFFTHNAIDDAKELADIYYSNGFDEVEAKAGVHVGTYKVFVNFIPIADITQLPTNLFKALQKNAIIVNGIYYAPPNYLRMAAYLELSRPDGDVSRWEKVWKRLNLLNKNYPIDQTQCNIRKLINDFNNIVLFKNKTINNIIINTVIKNGLIFFGIYALFAYSRYSTFKFPTSYFKQPFFDVLAINPANIAEQLKNNLEKANITKINIIKHKGVGEIISDHYEIQVDKQPIIFIYEPLACHSYNETIINNKIVNIASIDTILSFYLAFIYINKPYYNTNRLLCMAQYLLILQSNNRLKQKGILKPFSTICYGKQHSLETIRAEKAFLYNELKAKPCSKEYQKYFLRYIPAQPSECYKKNKKKTQKKKTQKKTQKKKNKKNNKKKKTNKH